MLTIDFKEFEKNFDRYLFEAKSRDICIRTASGKKVVLISYEKYQAAVTTINKTPIDK